MLFNSLQFILFFLAFFLIFFSIPQNLRKIWLLVASCYFYLVFKPVYLLILFSVILIDYVAGLQIEKTNRKKLWLVISLVSNIGILVYFKYYNFFSDSISALLHSFGSTTQLPLLEIILPIGLSFHTFQAMAYTIEVYRGNQKAETNLLHYSLYVLYFPQLVAGPIERPQHLLPQFKTPLGFNSQNFSEGLFRIATGFFKKVVIADRLALFVDPVYDHIAPSNGLSVILATFFFAFEIYCDFSGYTDIAIGISKIMGINLVENFKNPYLSKSIREFWTRWHISLSSWFRDYVYIPLGGNKTKTFRWAIIILFVFLLSGFWHGARWNFIIWGIIHGCLLILERIFSKKLSIKIPSFIKIIGVFISVCFAWIFFAVKEVKDAFTAIHHILNFSVNNVLPKVFNSGEMLFTILLLLLLLLSETFIKREWFRNKILLVSFAIIIFLLSYLFGEFNSRSFIYFQF